MNFIQKKLNGVIFKVDFEKAYDKVKWHFVQQTLQMKGFPPKWCRWVENFISGGSVSIKVNDDIGHYFQTKKGVWQGDPLSPVLFNIVADMLALLIKRAKNDGQIKGLYHILWKMVCQSYNMRMTPFCLWTMTLNKQKI